MRTIKFRGKKLENGEWLYGDLVQDDRDCCYIYPNNCGGLYANNKVGTDTIGQFIGLLDKNGREIYEGDIVKCDKFVYEVVFEEKRFASYGLCRKGDMFMHYFGEAMESQQCEVIGNIYDNLELLKGE